MPTRQTTTVQEMEVVQEPPITTVAAQQQIVSIELPELDLADRILLVGVGPHAKRIYFHYLSKLGLAPAVVVELASKAEETHRYLLERGLHSCVEVYLEDAHKDDEVLPEAFQQRLDEILAEQHITHAIISTEPKAHFAYLKYLVSRNLNVLTDKPITSPQRVSSDIRMAHKILEDYHVIAGLAREARQHGARLEVQCQRRYHPAYIYIRNLIESIIQEYGMPVTYLDVYHCDGMLNMPDEILTRENHPYKYGYGKLFHSGYHFIDLLVWLLQLDDFPPSKQPDNVEMYTSAFKPSDFFNLVDATTYQRLFKVDRFGDILANTSREQLQHFGEIDFHALIQFRKGQDTISTCSVNLLQSGFSRRSWSHLPVDTYKGNGRVRHERVNIQLGPLANIQVHSYQAYEISARDQLPAGTAEVGSIEHFDIYIFRNTGLIDGAPIEHISLEDMVFADTRTGSFIGYNEQARANCLTHFLGNGDILSDFFDHELTVKLLSNAYCSMSQRTAGQSPIVHFAL